LLVAPKAPPSADMMVPLTAGLLDDPSVTMSSGGCSRKSAREALGSLAPRR
jgi:hypothetical protein